VSGRGLFRVVWAVLALAVASAGWAQPVRREVLSDAEVAARADGFRLTVQFAMPVDYLSHVPLESGDTILIHIKPIVFDAKGDPGLSHREALRPPPEAPDYLTDIVYDGEDQCSRYLILHFSRKVRFRITPGGDLRSVLIDFQPAGAGAGSSDRAPGKTGGDPDKGPPSPRPDAKFPRLPRDQAAVSR